LKRRFDLFLKDIIDAIGKIEEYTDGMDIEDFKKSKITIDACVRNLEVIGEAVSQLDEKIKKANKQIPWQNIKDFRNVVIHKYHTIDVDILWDVIENKLQKLSTQIENIIKKM
jgi:uncharacterized protein with HEPN domain